jgi:hypothetical protein
MPRPPKTANSTHYPPPLGVVNLFTKDGAKPGPREKCMVHFCTHGQPLVLGGPYWVTPDQQGQAVVLVQNCVPYKITLLKKDPMGNLKYIKDCSTYESNPAYINAMAWNQAPPASPFSIKKRRFISETVQLSMPELYCCW